MHYENENLANEYIDEMPFVSDLSLFVAAKTAIYVIVVKNGIKKSTITNVAMKYKVKISELTELIESTIPKVFFDDRVRMARNRYENTFYKSEVSSPMTDEQENAGKINIKSIREILKSK
jgi:predicted ATPase